MDYTVKMTSFAINQVREIKRYITYAFSAPDIAEKYVKKIEEGILSLEFMPERCPIVEYEQWRLKKIRMLTINNFIVYYYVDNNEQNVWVIAVFYGKSDQLSALGKIP